MTICRSVFDCAACAPSRDDDEVHRSVKLLSHEPIHSQFGAALAAAYAPPAWSVGHSRPIERGADVRWRHSVSQP